METIGEKVSYLKGLCEGLNISDEKEGKVLKGIIDVLADISAAIEDVEDDVIEQIKMEESEEEFNFLSIDFSQMKFLEANKTFVERVQTVCASPVRPTAVMQPHIVVKGNRKNNNKRRNTI